MQRQSRAWQDDISNRVMLQYNLSLERSMINAKAGYFVEDLNYRDDLSGLTSESSFKTFLAEISGEHWIGKRHKVLLGNTTLQSQAFADDYEGGIADQFRSAFFGAWEYRTNKFESKLSIRYEHIDGTGIPVLPSLGIEQVILNGFSVSARVSRDFRMPTLNDLYWRPGGNPDLLPESGWSQEIGLHYISDEKGILNSASITTFNRNIDNWILWGLSENSFFWSASNLASVWSRGIELRSDLGFNYGKTHFRFQGGYDYIKSTNEIALDSPSLDEGEQLWYTPVHQGHFSLGAEWKGFEISYQHTITGATSGVNEDLEAFDLAILRFQFAPLTQKPKFTLFLNINNLWDETYFIMERRPMPGRNITAGLRITI